MKRMLLISLLFFATIGNAISVGDTFTQQQIDGFTKKQWINNVGFAFDGATISVQNLSIFFNLGYYTLNKLDENRTISYVVARENTPIKIGLLQFVSCYNDIGLDACLRELVKPKWDKAKDRVQETQLKKLSKFQTQNNLPFTIQDLNNALDGAGIDGSTRPINNGQNNQEEVNGT